MGIDDSRNRSAPEPGWRPPDIVICTYDNAVLLDRVLTALADQLRRRARLEGITVVDNNSPDDTRAVVAEPRAARDHTGICVTGSGTDAGATRRRGCVASGYAHRMLDRISSDDDCVLDERWVKERAPAFDSGARGLRRVWRTRDARIRGKPFERAGGMRLAARRAARTQTGDRGLPCGCWHGAHPRGTQASGLAELRFTSRIAWDDSFRSPVATWRIALRSRRHRTAVREMRSRVHTASRDSGASHHDTISRLG